MGSEADDFGNPMFKDDELLNTTQVELVSEELNHFGLIAGLFRQIRGHTGWFVLFALFEDFSL